MVLTLRKRWFFSEIQSLQTSKDKTVGSLRYGKEHLTDFPFSQPSLFSFASQITKLSLVQVNLLVFEWGRGKTPE